MTVEYPHTLQWDALSPKKLPLPMGRSGHPSNTWFPGPTGVLNPNSISIGSVVFAGLTSVTDRQTDRPTDHTTQSVTTGHIYIGSTAMRPKKDMIVTVTVMLHYAYTNIMQHILKMLPLAMGITCSS